MTVIVKFGCCCCLDVVCWEDPGVFEHEWIFGCGCVFSFAGVFKWQARLKGDEWSNSASVLGDYPRMERQATMYNSETPCLHGMKENWNWTRFLATGNITALYDGWAELHVHWDSDVFKKKIKNKNTIPFHKHQVIHQQQYFSFSSVTQIPLRIKEKKKKKCFEFFFLLFFVLVSVTMNANPIYCIKVLLKKIRSKGSTGNTAVVDGHFLSPANGSSMTHSWRRG